MRVWAYAIACLLVASTAHAAEICGDGIDNPPENGLTDEGCYPSMRTGVCESPLSCMDTGWLSWATGSLHYDLPPDIAPQSPYGPDIGFRRFYTSMYSPPSGGAFNRTPLGARWQHNYMSWIDRLPSGDIVIHTPQGEDVLATSLGLSDTLPPFERFELQARQQLLSIQFRNGRYEATSVGDATLYYSAAGELVEVLEGPVGPAGRVKIAWASTARGSAVSTVTDATTRRRLAFVYDTAGNLTGVELQFRYGDNPDTNVGWSTWKARTTYAYASSALSTVTNAAIVDDQQVTKLVQTNAYDNGLLARIDDAEGHSLVAFRYSSSNAGQTKLIDTPTGVLALDLGATRGTCSNKTILYFNKANTNACSTDGDCGSGAMCGGITGGPGKTGTCFRAARCLTLDSPPPGSKRETLVTAVSPLGPGTEECTGACADATRYVWNIDSQDLTATADGIGVRTTVSYNGNGFPTKIVYADSNDSASDGGGQRTVWMFWAGPRLTEIRRPSLLSAVASQCSETNETGCARTQYFYEGHRLEYFVQSGSTLDANGSVRGYGQTTTYTYDSKGRIETVDGPDRAPDGTNHDVTAYTYKDNELDPTQLGFLHTRTFRHTVPTLGDAPLYEYVWSYDIWGNATDWVDVGGGRSCARYDLPLNYQKWSSTELIVFGSGDCAVDDPADLITETTRDSALRPTKIKNADGSCVHYEYDTRGRLAQVKRRDDCNPASAGDRQQYTYDADGLPIEVVIYSATNEVKHRTKLAYYDSRRVQSTTNPVDTTKSTTIQYTPQGDIEVLSTNSDLGRTSFSYDHLRQRRNVWEHHTPTEYGLWELDYDAHGNRKLVGDPEGKPLRTTYDDLGRRVRQESPDQAMMPSVTSYTMLDRIASNSDPTQTRSFSYDPLGRLLTADYQGQCAKPVPETVPRPEVQNIYDALPLDNRYQCPIAAGCNNIRGRIAYARVTLMCSSAFLDDGALDQETFYSYDSAGRLVAEYIKDDSGRVASQSYVWSKSGLAQVTLPSTTKIGWTYGSTASNSDTDRVTAVWRTSTATPIVNSVLWNAFGPIAQYNRMDSISGSALRMKFAYNVAYRPTSIVLEGQNGVGPYYRLLLGEDGKGRITSRVYYPKDGVFDSFFRYDMLDRVLCETHTAVSSCPTVGATTVKNSHSLAFTGAGDRKTLIRGQQTNVFTLYDGTHRIKTVEQTGAAPTGTTTYTYDDRGNRIREDNPAFGDDFRQFEYDGRNNVKRVIGTTLITGPWHDYAVDSSFDARNRRVFKSFTDLHTSKQSQWFFYYDPYDRLTEVRYVPDASPSASSTFSTYQLFWLDDLLVTYWQTDYKPGVAEVTTKRYVSTDEQGRPVRMHNWPTSGNSTVVWATNPDAWGFDKITIGANLFQPIGFPGQYIDVETTSWATATVQNRPPLSLNGHRTYDPFTGSYLQLDPKLGETWQPYSYANGNPVGNTDPTGLMMNIPRKTSRANCTESWSSFDGGETWVDHKVWCDPIASPSTVFGTPFEIGSVFGGSGGQSATAPPPPPRAPTPRTPPPAPAPTSPPPTRDQCDEDMNLLTGPLWPLIQPLHMWKHLLRGMEERLYMSAQMPPPSGPGLRAKTCKTARRMVHEATWGALVTDPQANWILHP